MSKFVKYINGNFEEENLTPSEFSYVSVKIVQTLDDFPSPIGNEIFLEDKIYFIDSNDLDITGYTLVFGAKSQINGFGQNVNRISSSQNGAVFFRSNANLFMNDLEIVCNGINQRIWEHIGSNIVPEGESFELNRFNILCFQPAGHNNQLGYIKEIRQGFIGTMSVIGMEDGFKLAGPWTGGFRIDNTIFIACKGKFFYSDPLDPVTFQRRMASNANLSVPSGSIGYDFPPTAFPYSGQYQLQEGNFSGAGTYVTPWSGQSPAYDYRANFKDNTGIQNTYPGGEWTNTIDTTTDIITQNVYVTANLLTTNKNLAWFTEANGVFTYTSLTPLDVQLFVILSLLGTANNIIEMALVKEDIANVQTILLTRLTTLTGNVGQGRAETGTVTTTTQLVYGDKIKILLRNTSSSQDVIVVADSNAIITAK